MFITKTVTCVDHYDLNISIRETGKNNDKSDRMIIGSLK
jgi:hypothetical protein